MDKKKQIEEMAYELTQYEYSLCKRLPKNECLLTSKIHAQVCCDYCKIAEFLINAGYRKIPEGAVVLTKEEAKQVYGTVKAHGELLKDLQEAKSVFEKEMEEAQKEFVKQFEEHEKEVRKETAEKFAEMASEAFNAVSCEFDDRDWYQNMLDEICKEIIGGTDDDTSEVSK